MEQIIGTKKMQVVPKARLRTKIEVLAHIQVLGRLDYP
jgi:hypothetical protein